MDLYPEYIKDANKGQTTQVEKWAKETNRRRT